MSLYLLDGNFVFPGEKPEHCEYWLQPGRALYLVRLKPDGRLSRWVVYYVPSWLEHPLGPNSPYIEVLEARQDDDFPYSEDARKSARRRALDLATADNEELLQHTGSNSLISKS